MEGFELTSAKVVVLGIALAAVAFYGFVAIIGRVVYGSRVLIDRRTDRLGFWVVWLACAAVTFAGLPDFYSYLQTFPAMNGPP